MQICLLTCNKRNGQGELHPGSSPESQRDGRQPDILHQGLFITRLKHGYVFSLFWKHLISWNHAAKWNAAQRKLHLWKLKCLHLMSSASSDYAIWYWPHCLKKIQNYCENVSVRTMDSDQTHKQKASLSKAFASCQCFKLYTISTVKKWQTAAAQLSVQNIRQDKPQLSAKYSCKTGLFHRF